jgi:hypothetical protein
MVVEHHSSTVVHYGHWWSNDEMSMMEMTYVVTFLLLLSFKMRNVYFILYMCGGTGILIVLFINFIFHLVMLLFNMIFMCWHVILT